MTSMRAAAENGWNLVKVAFFLYILGGGLSLVAVASRDLFSRKGGLRVLGAVLICFALWKAPFARDERVGGECALGELTVAQTIEWQEGLDDATGGRRYELARTILSEGLLSTCTRRQIMGHLGRAQKFNRFGPNDIDYRLGPDRIARVPTGSDWLTIEFDRADKVFNARITSD